MAQNLSRPPRSDDTVYTQSPIRQIIQLNLSGFDSAVEFLRRFLGWGGEMIVCVKKTGSSPYILRVVCLISSYRLIDEGLAKTSKAI